MSVYRTRESGPCSRLRLLNVFSPHSLFRNTASVPAFATPDTAGMFAVTAFRASPHPPVPGTRFFGASVGEPLLTGSATFLRCHIPSKKPVRRRLRRQGDVQKNAVPPPADSKGVPLKSRSAAFIFPRSGPRGGRARSRIRSRSDARYEQPGERSDGSGEGNPFFRKGSLPRSFYPSINPALTNSTNRRLGVMGMALTATPVASRTALRSAGAGLMIGGSPSDLLP